jgi:hypothetical protein
MNLRHRTVVLLVGWLWLGAARADTVRLKTGATFEGTILSETDTAVSIEVEHAGGTILSTETFKRDEVAEVVRSTPEELAQRAMERAYANIQKYRLDPGTSYSPEYYRLVIDGVLRRFLTDYPNSSHTNAVQAKLNEWITEQGTVASGMGKYNGIWMHAEEVARRKAEAQARSNPDRNKALGKSASTGTADATGLAATPTVESATAGNPVQRDVVDQVGELLSRYWVVAIVVVVVMLWACVHIFTRD